MKNSLGKAMILVSIASSLSLLISFLRETVTAGYYGISSVTDAYNIATQLPVILFSTVSMAISTVIIPAYAKRHAEKGEEEANLFASNYISILGIIALLFVLLCEVIAPVIIKITAPGLAAEQSALAIRFFRMVVPSIIFTALIKVNNGIMNYYGEFKWPVLIVNIFSFVFIAFVVLFSKTIGIEAALLGTLLGAIAEFCVSCLCRRRYVKYKPYINIYDPEVINSLKLSIPVFVGIGVDEIGKIVDKTISSFLDTGSISSLNYGAKLSTAVSSLMLSGISAVSYPEFTKSAAVQDDQRIGDVYNFSLRMYCMILLPVLTGGVILNKEIIMVVFQRGAFDMEAVYRTAPLFACYLVSLLFSSLRTLSSNLLYAYRDTKTPMINSSIGIITNIVLSILLSKPFKAIGVALATVVSTALVCVLLGIQIKKRNGFISYFGQWKSFLKYGIACVGLAFTVFGIKAAMMLSKAYRIDSFVNNIFFIGASIIAGGMIYLGLLYALKCSEVYAVANAIKRRFGYHRANTNI